MVADLGCLGCAFNSGKYSSPFRMNLVGQAVSGAAYSLFDRALSRGLTQAAIPAA